MAAAIKQLGQKKSLITEYLVSIELETKQNMDDSEKRDGPEVEGGRVWESERRGRRQSECESGV